MDSLARQNRVSDRHVQNILRMVALLNMQESAALLQALGTLSRGPLAAALINSIDEMRAKPKKWAPDFFASEVVHPKD
jgi:hypothetical protein